MAHGQIYSKILALFTPLCSLILITAGQSVNTPIGGVYGYEGCNVTLVCDLRDIYDFRMIWYHQDVRLFISVDETFFSKVPDELRRRISVNCERGDVDGRCSLTISSLNMTDSGTYKCGYLFTSSKFYVLSTGTLTVGTLPSDDSPICSTSRQDMDGVSTSINNTYAIGDQIYLKCEVNDSTIPVVMYWTSQHGNDVSNITQPDIESSIQYEILLLQEHIGTKFVCIIDLRPILSEVRQCSITPLPASTSVPHTTTSPQFSDMPSEITSSHVLAILSIIISSLVAVAIVVVVVVLKRRKSNKNNELDPNTNGKITFNKQDSAVHFAGFKAANSARPTETSSTLNHADDKPDMSDNVKIDEGIKSSEKETEINSVMHTPPNIPRKESSNQDEKTDDGLMYADLKLVNTMDSNSHEMPLPTNPDAIVYADIREPSPP